MRTALILGLLVSFPAAASAALPPIRSAAEAVAQLSASEDSQRLEALSNFKRSCRGRLRHSLRDNAAVVSRLVALSAVKKPEVRKATMEAASCLSGASFAKVLAAQLDAKDPESQSFALEVAGRVQHRAVTKQLLEQLKSQGEACLADKLEEPEIERCVWLTYAPGASLVDEMAYREQAAELASKQLESPYPKVREVAVETVAAAKLKQYAPALETLLKKEKARKFKTPNNKSLLSRFAERLKELQANGE